MPVLSVLLQQSGCRMLLGAFAARNRATLRRTLSVHSSCSEKPAELSAPTPAGSFSTAGANCCGRCRGGPDCAGQASADGGCPSGGSGAGRCGAAGPDFSSRDSANILHGAFSCGASAIGHLQCCSSMSGAVNSNRGRPVWHVWVSLVGSSCFKHMHVGHHDAVNASHAAQCALHECVAKTQIAICRCPCTCSGPCGGTCSGCQFAASGCLTRRGAEGTHCLLSGTDCQGVGSEARADHLGPAACRCQATREEKRCCRPRSPARRCRHLQLVQLASANARASGQLVRRVWTAHPVLAKLVARKVQLPSRLPSLQTMSPPVQSNPLPAARLVKGCLHMGLPTVLALQALALALVLALSCCQWAPAARLVLAMACIPGRCIARMTGNRRLQTPLGGSA